MGTVWNDKHSLFKDLPKALRFEVAMSMYNGVAHEIYTFSLRDQAFIVNLMPMMKPLKYSNDEMIYKEGDYPDEVLFITKGRVDYILYNSDMSYRSYAKGSYIGEIEILQDKSRRLDNVRACGDTEFMFVSKKEFLDLLLEFPEDCKEFKKVAKERFLRN